MEKNTPRDSWHLAKEKIKENWEEPSDDGLTKEEPEQKGLEEEKKPNDTEEEK